VWHCEKLVTKNKTKMKLIILFFLTSFLSYPQQSELINLKIAITNIQEVKGNMIIKIFNNSDSFPRKGKPYKVYSQKVTTKIVSVVLKDLKKGKYAISLYHDVNSDNECNMNFLGIPTESFGFSRNFNPKLSAPSFEDCYIDANQDRSIKIELID